MEPGATLAGRVVVVTRDEGDDEGCLSRGDAGAGVAWGVGPASLGDELRSRGATVLSWPTVRIAPPADPAPLEDAIQQLASYDWIVFTSARAVQAVLSRSAQRGREAPPAALRVAAVGTGTARAVRAYGWPVHVEPEEHSSVALVRTLAAVPMAGCRVLFPASSLAGRTLVQGLGELGAIVEEVVAYRTEPLPLPPDALAQIEALLVEAEDGRPRIDAICFASPSSVRAWAEAFGQGGCARLGQVVVVAAIGSTTAAALRGAGLLDPVVARESTFAGLADAVVDAFRGTARQREMGS